MQVTLNPDGYALQEFFESDKGQQDLVNQMNDRLMDLTTEEHILIRRTFYKGKTKKQKKANIFGSRRG